MYSSPALIDVSRLPLNKAEETPCGGLHIARSWRNSTDLASNPLVEKRYPMHRARCWPRIAAIAATCLVGGNLLRARAAPISTPIATPAHARRAAAARRLRLTDETPLGTSDSCPRCHPVGHVSVALALLEAKFM